MPQHWQDARTPVALAFGLLLPLVYFLRIPEGVQSNSKYQTFIISHGRPQVLGTWQVMLRGWVIAGPCYVEGYNIALTSLELPSLEAAFGSESSLVGWVAASSCTGCIAGVLANTWFLENYGRLRVHRWTAAALYFSEVLMLLAPNITAYLVGRTLMGAASGCALAVSSLYAAEIAPKDLRGLLVSLAEWSVAVGCVFGFFLSAFPSMTFREHALLGLPCPLMVMTVSPLLAESPRWLAQQGRIEEARAVLDQYVQDPDEAAQTAVALGDKAGTSVLTNPIEQFTRLLTDPVNLRQLIWPALLMCFEEMVGTEVSDDYCVRFLAEGGVPTRSMIATITVASVAFKTFGLAISGLLLDRFGRKSWLLSSLIVQTIAGAYLSQLYGTGNWQPLVLAWMVYNVSYGTGLGNICLVVLAESFSDPSMRVAAVSFCHVLNRALAALLTGTYLLQRQLIGTANIFLLWACFSAMASVATVVFMTERRGTILEHA